VSLPYQHPNPPRTASGPRLTALGDAAAFNPYAGYNPAADAMRGGWGNQENAAGRYERWLRDAQNIAAQRGYALSPEQQAALQQRGLGGIQWAEQQGGGGASGFNWGGYDPSQVYANTYNPGEAVEHIVHGTVPQHAGVWGTAAATPGQSAQGATTLYQHLNMALDPMQETFYQANNPLLWGAVGHQFAPNTEAPRGDWWRQRYTQAQNDYANATALGTDPNLSFVAWLNQQYPQISQKFGLLSAAARGESSPFLPAGRPQL
jgi:hypothetical protein